MTPAPARASTLRGRVRTSWLAVVAVLLVVAVATTTRTVVRQAHYEPALRSGITASHDLAAAHAAMLDQETGVRGYLLSGDVAFLEPFQRGQQEYLRAAARASRSVADDRALRDALDATALAALRWMTAYASSAVAAQRAGDVAHAPPVAEGKALFDAYRAHQAEALRLHDAAVLRVLDAQQRFGTVLSGTELVAGGLAAAVLLRRGRRLREELFAPLGALDEHARRLAQGQLERPVDLGAAPQELATTVASLERLRDRLVRQERQLGAERLATSRRVQLHQAVLQASAEFSAVQDLQATCTEVVEAARRVSGCGAVCLWLAEPTGLELAATTLSATLTTTCPGDGELEPRAEQLMLRASRFGREEADLDGEQDLVALPLVAAGRTIAVVLLRDVPTTGDGVDRLDAVRSLAAHAASALAAARLHADVLTASLRDELTGLWNRRRFNEDLPREAGLAVRHGHPLSLLMLDLDRFKAYNDAHGHPAGDALLREVGALLAESLRDGDAAYRLGGEEFAVLLSHDDEASGRRCGERLRSLVETRLARRGVTVSVGVAALDVAAGAGTPAREALVRQADEALYAAKSDGRNRVVAASDTTAVGAVPAPRADAAPVQA